MALRQHLGRSAALAATAVALSVLTPRSAQAKGGEHCASIAVGTYNAWYNTTGSRIIASMAARETFNACMVVHWLT